jgi:serine protease Do
MTTPESPSPHVEAPWISPRPAYRPRCGLRKAIVAVPLLIAVMGAGLIGFALAGLGGAVETAPAMTLAAATIETAAATAATASATTATGLADVSDIAAAVVDSVVKIEITASFRGRRTVVASGSGVIVDAGGTIVTNAHVVEAGSGIDVVLADGTTYDATVLTVDSAHDLALVSTAATDLAAIELGATDGLLVGDPLIAVGNPLGLDGGPSVSIGIVSALGRTLEDSGSTLTGIIQTDAAITEGSSGGALLDGTGRLVGITTAVGVSSVGIEGMGFAVPVEAISALLSATPGV